MLDKEQVGDLNVADKKQLLNLISPIILNAKTGEINLKIHRAHDW